MPKNLKQKLLEIRLKSEGAPHFGKSIPIYFLSQMLAAHGIPQLRFQHSIIKFWANTKNESQWHTRNYDPKQAKIPTFKYGNEVERKGDQSKWVSESGRKAEKKYGERKFGPIKKQQGGLWNAATTVGADFV